MNDYEDDYMKGVKLLSRARKDFGLLLLKSQQEFPVLKRVIHPLLR